MPQSLIPLNLDLPGRLGISSEADSGGLDASWASHAENCVFDNYGRLCSRKAFKLATTTPLLGNPDVNTLFEYVKNTSTTYIISVNSDAEIRHGTATLTDVTGSLSFTETHWQFQNFEGDCIGVAQGEDPVHWDGTSNFVTLYSKIPNSYATSTAYVLGDIIKPVASATTDYYLVCTTAGTTSGTEPTWSATEGATNNERDGLSNWQASTSYSLGDCVTQITSPNTAIHFECTTAGTSNDTEPTWDETVGNTTADTNGTGAGNVVWTARTSISWTTVVYPKGRCILAAYGRVWILSEDRTTIRYSALGLGYDFSSTNGGGTIDTTAVFGRNDDFVTALATFNNNLVIFSRFNTLIYSNISSPGSLTIVDQIVGTGCIARDTVQNLGNDLVFLSYQGLRSLGRTIQLEKVPLQDLSINVRNVLISEVQANLPSVVNDTNFKSVYSPTEGFYILKTGDYYYIFDFKKSFGGEDYQPPRVTTWGSQFGAQSMAVSRDETLYLAKGGAVGTYADNTEWGYDTGATAYADGLSYLMSYRGAWADFKEIDPSLASRTKIIKKYYGSFRGGEGYTVDFTLGYDFLDNEARFSKDLQVSSGSEWSLGEWGLAEWSGNTANVNTSVHSTGSGQHVQIGMDINIDGAGFCIQTIVLFIKLGRLVRS